MSKYDKRLDRLERRAGGDDRIVVCWCAEGACTCDLEGAEYVIRVKYADGPADEQSP